MTPDEIDPDNQVSPGWFTRHPLLSGAIAAIIAALLVAVFLPSLPPAPDDARVNVISVAEQPTPADTVKASDAPTPVKAQEAGTPPPAAVPIVAEVAVVVADTGLNRRVAEAIDKDLPKDTTLAISVYAGDTAATAAAFKSSGRDIWLQVAAQSLKGGIDPGPLAIAGALSKKDNADLFTRQIAMAGGNAVGVYIPDDADITSVDPDMWRDIASDLIGENLMVLDATSAKVATSLYMQKSESKITAYLKTDALVSGDMGPAVLQKALDDAIPVILKEQQAIVVLAHPTVLAVETLSAWVKTLSDKGIRLVPAAKFTGLKG